MYSGVFFFFVLHAKSSPTIIIGLGLRIYHIKTLSVVDRTLKNFNKNVSVSRKNSLKSFLVSVFCTFSKILCKKNKYMEKKLILIAYNGFKCFFARIIIDYIEP